MTTYPTLYDEAIREAMDVHWPQAGDWRWGKAQLIAESNLDPKAISPVGACGLAQFMPDTWHQVAEELEFPLGARAGDPAYALPAYAFYMEKCWFTWSSPKRSGIDRIRLGQASYNAGVGNLLKAQRLVGGAVEYDRIVSALPRVTGALNARQTTDYVARIGRIYAQLIAA